VFSGQSPLRLPHGSLATGAPSRIVVPIVVGGAPVGYLSIVEELPSGDADDGELAWRVAPVFGIVFARLRSALEVESRYRDNLLDALVLASDVDETWAVARASLLEHDLTAPQSLLLLGVDSTEPPTVSPSPDDLVELLAPWARGFGRGGIAAVKEGAVVLLLAAVAGERSAGSGRRGAARATARLDRSTARLVDAVRREIGTRYPDASISIVAAPAVVHWRELRRSYRVARQAFRVLCRFGERGASISTADPRLALFFLLEGANPDTVAGFVDRILGTLLVYDRQHGRSLIETLEAYLGEYGNLESTARRLTIHTSTLKYRLARISELSGLDLRNADHRFNAALALRLRALRSISD
jgi:sugar diacid utilization regulator